MARNVQTLSAADVVRITILIGVADTTQRCGHSLPFQHALALSLMLGI
jgi:hypothetical protein